MEKRQFYHVSIIEINILFKFHEENMLFDEIKGYSLTLLFSSAKTRISEGLLWEKAINLK